MSDGNFVISLDEVKGGEQLAEDVATIVKNLEGVLSFNEIGGLLINTYDHNFNINANIVGYENLEVKGDVTLSNTLDVSGDCLFKSNVDISNNLNVKNNTFLYGDLEVSGNLTLHNKLVDINVTNLFVEEDISLNGNIKLKQGMLDVSSVYVSNNAIVENDLLTKSLHVEDTSTFYDDLNIQRDLYVNKQILVDNDSILLGNLDVCNLLNENATVKGMIIK